MNRLQLQSIVAGLAVAAIVGAPLGAIAQITYSGSSVYKTTDATTNKTKIWFSGTPGSAVQLNWSVQPTDPTKPPVPKTRLVILGACGFKAVTQSATFPATFTIGSDSYTTASLPTAPKEPYCRKGTPYIPSSGWTSSLPQFWSNLSNLFSGQS